MVDLSVSRLRKTDAPPTDVQRCWICNLLHTIQSTITPLPRMADYIREYRLGFSGGAGPRSSPIPCRYELCPPTFPAPASIKLGAGIYAAEALGACVSWMWNDLASRT
jgi:hypothetical protein